MKAVRGQILYCDLTLWHSKSMSDSSHSATSQILEQDRRFWFLVYNIHIITTWDLYFFDKPFEDIMVREWIVWTLVWTDVWLKIKKKSWPSTGPWRLKIITYKMVSKKNEINRSIITGQPPYSHNLIIPDYEGPITESDFSCSVNTSLWLVRGDGLVALTAIQSTGSDIYQIFGPNSSFISSNISPRLFLRDPIFSSSLTWNLTLRWIASWFLQKCKKF